MRVARSYLSWAVAGGTALVLAVLLSLAAFIEFVGQLDELGEGSYGILQALGYVGLKLPTFAFVMLPIAVLLGALLGLGNLASRSELIALRAAGFSPLQIARGALGAGVVLGLFALLLGEYLGPPAERFARQYRAMAKFGEDMPQAGPSSWIRDGEIFLNVLWPSERNPSGGVFLYRVRPGEGLQSLGRAESLEPGDGNSWSLKGFAETRFGSDGVQVAREQGTLEGLGLNPELLGMTVLRPNTLDGRELLGYVRYLRRNDLDARQYEVEFWSRIAAAVAVPLMCLLAVPFVLGPLRRAGNGGRLLIGVVIGLGYFLASRALSDGGVVWNLTPLVTAWAPTALLALAAAWALVRAR